MQCLFSECVWSTASGIYSLIWRVTPQGQIYEKLMEFNYQTHERTLKTILIKYTKLNKNSKQQEHVYWTDLQQLLRDLLSSLVATAEKNVLANKLNKHSTMFKNDSFKSTLMC